MRFPFGQLGRGRFSSHSSTLPLSTLLLAALCVLLTAPVSQASSHEAALGTTSAAILTQVLAASATSSQLSALETRQVRVLLSRLEKTTSKLSLPESITQLERELSTLDTAATEPAPLPELVFFVKSKPQYFLTPHEAASLSGVRTNAYLE